MDLHGESLIFLFFCFSLFLFLSPLFKTRTKGGRNTVIASRAGCFIHGASVGGAVRSSSAAGKQGAAASSQARRDEGGGAAASAAAAAVLSWENGRTHRRRQTFHQTEPVPVPGGRAEGGGEKGEGLGMLALGLSWPRFARSPPSAGKYVFSPSAPIGRDGFRRPGINHLLGKKKSKKKQIRSVARCRRRLLTMSERRINNGGETRAGNEPPPPPNKVVTAPL